jgi:glucokinase
MLSPGTGLGEAFFVESGQKKQVFDSEGGHCHFAPVGQEQLGLLQFCQAARQTVTFDNICCGDGFVHIYNYLKQGPAQPFGADVQKAILAAEHPAAIITENAMLADPKRRCPLCVHTVEIFVEILAGEAANMVLKMLARGGVFIGGGIPPKILPYLHNNFMPAFMRHQSMGHILSGVPVHVVCNPRAALYGAALFAVEHSN